MAVVETTVYARVAKVAQRVAIGQLAVVARIVSNVPPAVLFTHSGIIDYALCLVELNIPGPTFAAERPTKSILAESAGVIFCNAAVNTACQINSRLDTVVRVVLIDLALIETIPNIVDRTLLAGSPSPVIDTLCALPSVVAKENVAQR